MMKRTAIMGVLAGLLACGLVGEAKAASVLVDSSYFTGSRTTGAANGIVPGGIWSVNGLMFSWNISFDSGTNLYTYVYKISDDASSTTPIVMGGVSHLDLETSPTFTLANVKTGSDTVDSLATFSSSGSGGSTPNMPAAGLYGIKFNFGGLNPSYTLVTDRAPIWGDFYTKDGTAGGMGANTAWNTGFGTDATASTTDFTYWVPTPDTISSIPVPVPAAAWMGVVTMGLAGLVGAARSRKAKA
ncbi:MAG: hypothetical protein NTW19_14850 [Planctomycetota bacterium]|nr:hypothetical protein [Planctomycetota bacterium]